MKNRYSIYYTFITFEGVILDYKKYRIARAKDKEAIRGIPKEVIKEARSIARTPNFNAIPEKRKRFKEIAEQYFGVLNKLNHTEKFKIDYCEYGEVAFLYDAVKKEFTVIKNYAGEHALKYFLEWLNSLPKIPFKDFTKEGTVFTNLDSVKLFTELILNKDYIDSVYDTGFKSLLSDNYKHRKTIFISEKYK